MINNGREEEYDDADCFVLCCVVLLFYYCCMFIYCCHSCTYKQIIFCDSVYYVIRGMTAVVMHHCLLTRTIIQTTKSSPNFLSFLHYDFIYYINRLCAHHNPAKSVFQVGF